MREMIPLALAAGLVAACANHRSYVRVDDVTLGRVVIYRNGVAYYERMAEVPGNELTVTVPRDKVDDFLKSLTVVDARTGEVLPVGFPRQETLRDGVVDMTIQLPETKDKTNLVLTYVTESPAWKPSYRVMVEPNGKVHLQAWAIVDNTSGEDWKNVRIGVGSSSALSFRYDLWSVRDIHRETLAGDDRFATAPPRGVSPYRQRRPGEKVISELGDEDIPRAPGHPEYEPADDTMSGGGGSGRHRTSSHTRSRSTKREESGRWDRGRNRVRELAKKMKRNQKVIIIEGYASEGERDGRQRAGDRANMLRNRLIEEGVPPARLKVRNLGVVAGRGGGVRLVMGDGDETRADGKGPARVAEIDTPVGESHFESPTPMTVKRGTSVMVSIVNSATNGEVVYLYDPESQRGNARYAFRAVRLRNPTDSTLETGPVTVYGDNRFIGEGLTEPIPPKGTAVVPFALDRQVIVEVEGSTDDEIESLVTLQRGILTAKVQHLRKRRLKITNRLHHAAKVFVRYTAQKGWTLTEHPKKHERVGTAHLFLVTVGAGATRVVEIEEATPIVKTLDLRTEVGLKLVRFYLSSSKREGELGTAIEKLLALHTKAVDEQATIDNMRQRLGDYRVRMDELHAQIVTLKMVKTKGELMRHLKEKLKEISTRVQKATIALVNMEESLMLTRIRFQDSVAELSLEKRVMAKN